MQKDTDQDFPVKFPWDSLPTPFRRIAAAFYLSTTQLTMAFVAAVTLIALINSSAVPSPIAGLIYTAIVAPLYAALAVSVVGLLAEARAFNRAEAEDRQAGLTG